MRFFCKNVSRFTIFYVSRIFLQYLVIDVSRETQNDVFYIFSIKMFHVKRETFLLKKYTIKVKIISNNQIMIINITTIFKIIIAYQY